MAAQVIGTVIGVVFNTGGAFFVLDNLTESLGVGNDLGAWGALNYNTFLSAAGIWGSIGPARFFGIGSPYQLTLVFNCRLIIVGISIGDYSSTNSVGTKQVIPSSVLAFGYYFH